MKLQISITNALWFLEYFWQKLTDTEVEWSRSGKFHYEQGHILSPGAQLKGVLTLFTKYKSNTEWGSKFIVIKQ